jgi:hypothetical protein
MKEPSIKETAFSCPHCGAYTTQHWYDGYVKYIGEGSKKPFIPDANFEKSIIDDRNLKDEFKTSFIEINRKMRSKLLFTSEKGEYLSIPQLNNLFLSHCYNCGKWSVWVNEDLLYPPKKFGTPPNKDLPSDVLPVVEEARSILDLSPKGAAALLRLSIQMLCKFLGESGKDLNVDIANLVKKGLSPLVSKSLDVVRVIGNEAVHPGSIDLNDDKDIAMRLFDLINIIAEQMITYPKNVNELYGRLPESKRSAIEIRNKKALENKK